MNLRRTQAALQRHILGQDEGIGRVVEGDEKFPVRQRLGVYAYAYGSRLTEALQQNFPAVAKLLGDERFGETAHDYIREHPSQFASIRYFGHSFADFLCDRADGDATIMLADLARWEWALAAAFDGPDAQPLPAEALAGRPAQHWPALSFRLAAALQRVTLRSNAVDWWRFAVQDGARPAGAVGSSVSEWAVWRTGLTTSFRSLPLDEARMVDGALRGQCFADLCAHLAGSTDGAAGAMRAAALLKGWFSAGWIVGLDGPH